MAIPIRRRTSMMSRPPDPVEAVTPSRVPVSPDATPSNPALPVHDRIASPSAQSSPIRPPSRFGGAFQTGRPAGAARTVEQPALPPFGRSKWPPAPGRDYDDFLMWASNGEWPSEDDTNLAIGLFMGLVPHPGTGPEPDEPVSRGPGF